MTRRAPAPHVALRWLGLLVLGALNAAGASEPAPPAGGPATLAAALAELGRIAGVSIVLDPDVDPAGLALDRAFDEAADTTHAASGGGASLAVLNRHLAGRGAVAVAVEPTLWRIVRDPFAVIALDPYTRTAPLPRPPLRDRSGSVWRPVVRLPGGPPSVDSVPRQVGNVYGTGARLFVRGVARNRYGDSGEDVGLHWNGLPLPNFLVDVTDLRLPGHELTIRRGPDPRQQRGSPGYGGYLDLAPRAPADAVGLRVGSDGSRGAEVSLSLGAGRPLGASLVGSWLSDRWSTPARGGRAAGDAGTLSARARFDGGPVALRLESLLVDADGGPRSWLLRTGRPGQAALPSWGVMEARLGAVRASAGWGDGADRFEFTAGLLRAEGRFEQRVNDAVASVRDSDRRYAELGLGFERRVDEIRAFGVALGLARSRDGIDGGTFLALDSLRGFTDEAPALRLRSPYAFGTSAFQGSDLERRYGTLWASWTGETWSAYGSLRLEDLTDRRSDEHRVRGLGEAGCRVTVTRPIDWYALLLEPGDEPGCFYLAHHLTGHRARAPVAARRNDRYATVDLSLRRALGPSAGLTARVYNRARGPSLLPTSAPLARAALLPAERLHGIELAFDHETAAIRHSVTAFANAFRRDTPGADAPPGWLPERIAGLEWDGAWRLCETQLLTWSLGHLTSETRAGAPQGAPDWSGAVSWEWRPTGALTLGAVLSHTGPALADGANPELAERTGGQQLDLSLRYDAGIRGEYGLGLENVTNERFLRTIYDTTVTQSGVVPTQERRLLAWWRFDL